MPTTTRSTPARLSRLGFKILLLACAVALSAAARVPARAATIEVHAGGDLQAALDAAQPGDEVVLDAGAVFVGNFTLPVKTGSSYITVRSSLCGQLPAGVRVTLAAAPLMARVSTPNTGPALDAPVNSHHWRLQCLEVTQSPAVADYTYNLVELGDGDTFGPQDTLAEVPHHFELDRCLVRARDAATRVQRGVSLNSAHTTIRNSHISDIKWEGVESQGIGGHNGPGPYAIENNYIEAAAINIIFGGALPAVPDLVSSDILIRGNHLFKPLSWRVGDPAYAGRHWTVKNLLELKSARRVRIEGNVMENSWVDSQEGWAVIFNVFAGAPQYVIEDVEFVNNIIRNACNGINVRGIDDPHTAVRGKRLRFANNLLENVGAFDGMGRVFQLVRGSESVSFDHNTATNTGSNTVYLDTRTSFKHVGCSFTNNVFEYGGYGVFSEGGAQGQAALELRCGPGWTFAGNLLAGDLQGITYPANNHYPADFEGQFADFAGRDYRLAPTSCGSAASSCAPKGGTDGKDSGVDFVALHSATAGVARANAALASNGATASASSTLDPTRLPVAAINGDRRGLHWGSGPVTDGSGWTDATQNSFPDWLEVTFEGAKVIDEIDVFSLQNSFASPSEPTPSMTFSFYGLTAFDVQYWDGSQWVTVPGGQVTGNNKVWRKLTFPPVVTTKVRVLVNSALSGYSRVVELEAWTASVERSNHALSANGATASASSTLDPTRLPVAAINGDRKGLHWGSGPVTTGSGWTDATQNSFPDWLEVTFDGTKAISEVSVFSLQNAYASPSEPTEAMTFSFYGLTAFDVQYWTGSGWATVPGGTVTGNNKVWRKLTFPHVMTNRIRVLVNGALSGYSRVVEVEAY